MIQNEQRLASTPRHSDLLDGLIAGIEAAHPRTVVENKVGIENGRLRIGTEQYDLDAYEQVLVVGGGNAAGTVTAALETKLASHIDGGVVVTDVPVGTNSVTVIEGTHPLPSEENVEGTRELLEVEAKADEATLVLVVITGGGSALLCAPEPSISVGDYRELTEDLLRSGATIGEINAIRKHISTIKGGRLAEALHPATVAGVVFSDVVGDRLDTIASGPTVPDMSTYADCLAVRDRYDLTFPDSVGQILETGAAGERQETPDTETAVFANVTNHILANGRTALEATAMELENRGYTPVILSSQIEGEASEIGPVHADIGAECLEYGSPVEPPVALLSGGETTVTVSGDGRGGPNQEFALSLASQIGDQDLLAGSIDTDGIDGNTDVAGALVDAETVPADNAGTARTALQEHTTYSYLKQQGCLIETGPTGTNVNDLRILLAGRPDEG